ncbi:unnamed protein product [Prorocentrum cordatum]|uniref:Uncharacterized protein n=1 Tax=Prorocentrum cordatum TaxID=2364126 RepID=A0ABN9YCD9_9DINO|nr:unnamed protein product [Polarella glacialis]
MAVSGSLLLATSWARERAATLTPGSATARVEGSLAGSQLEVALARVPLKLELATVKVVEDEAAQLATLSDKAGDAASAKKHRDVAKHLAALEHPPEVEVHPVLQSQRAAVRRAEKKCEGDLQRLLQLQKQVQEPQDRVRESRKAPDDADAECQKAVAKLSESTKASTSVAAGPVMTCIKMAVIVSGNVDFT